MTGSASALPTTRTRTRLRSRLYLLGGRPIREPVAHYGPFVMNTKDELVKAIEDYQAGRLGVIPDNALMPHTF